ncbi:MAG: hypothetical protein ABIW80_03415 [Lapillicoccus sp.]
MRWERLFDDLEAQLEADASRELSAEVADRTRRERAQLRLAERLTAVVDAHPVELRVAGLGTLRGVVWGTGPEWVLLDQRAPSPHGSVGEGGPDRPVLVATTAIRAVVGLAGARPGGAVARGFGLGAALRAVSRDRAVVDVVDIDGTVVTGTIDAVGQDLVEIAEHPGDLPRRSEHVLRVVAMPFLALAAVRRR